MDPLKIKEDIIGILRYRLRKALADKDAAVADSRSILVSRNRAVADRNASERMSIELQMKIDKLTTERDEAITARLAAENAKTTAELDMNSAIHYHFDCAKAHDELLKTYEEFRKSYVMCVQKIYELTQERDHIFKECVRLTKLHEQTKYCIKSAKVEPGR